MDRFSLNPLEDEDGPSFSMPATLSLSSVGLGVGLWIGSSPVLAGLEVGDLVGAKVLVFESIDGLAVVATEKVGAAVGAGEPETFLGLSEESLRSVPCILGAEVGYVYMDMEKSIMDIDPSRPSVKYRIELHRTRM